MNRRGSDLLFAATDLSNFLGCAHLTALARAEVNGEIRKPRYDDPSLEVIRQRGLEHERLVLEQLRARGLTVVEPAEPPRLDKSRDWQVGADATLEAMRTGADIVYQGTLFDGRWVARPDFLRRVERPSALGAWSYEVIDAKLAREAKAGAVLQICLYSDLVTRVQGTSPEAMHLALGKQEGELESFRVTDYAAYFRSVRGRFLEAAASTESTYPEPVSQCDVCDWHSVCDARWHADDHLSLVAGINGKQRAQLEERGVATLAGLARLPLPLDPALDGVSAAAYAQIREQARIQLEGRVEDRHKYELFTDTQDGNGLLALPEPSEGDLFFDIEGDPHAFDEGLEYLLGYADAEGAFMGLWALTPDEERAQFEAFIDVVMERLDRWPDLHVYHYAAYEPTAVKRLAARYATREDPVDRLLRGGVFVDLYRAIRQGLRASVESYSIKKLEPLYLFEREVDLRAASSALANFEAWLYLGGLDGADPLLKEIEGYNRDDCISTLRLRDWLEERRTEVSGILGRPLPRPEPPTAEPSENVQEEIERVQQLMDALTAGVSADPEARTEDEHARWILAHLLFWHRREKKSLWWEYFRMLELDEDELLRESKPLAGLRYEGVVGQVRRSLIHRYRFPPQDFGLRPGDTPHDPATGAGAGEIVALDEADGTVDLQRGANNPAPHPRALIPYESVPDGVLRESLQALAADVVAHGLDGTANRAGADLLLRRRPRAGQ
ncbi:MAG: TM0106 family RecB-like putative nuclease, partial [Longimicrobiales bacterium]|nr:TM0106 family RecB-like putative nuclease [Longimicrobiales bacterium]